MCKKADIGNISPFENQHIFGEEIISSFSPPSASHLE